MPKVTFTKEKRTLALAPGANLREAMLQAEITPYAGGAKLLNCRGRGECKTCKVKVAPDGNVSPRTAHETPRARGRILQMIDHRELIGWRLSCQVKVYGDISVTTAH